MFSTTFHRREFIRKAGCAALGTTGILSALGNLRLLQGAAALQTAFTATDYRALVCVFLYGGNDANNMIVPSSGNDYNSYAATRGLLAIPQNSLLPISPTHSDGRSWGLHPSLVEMRDLFASGQLAFVANVGTLVAPITRAQYKAKSVAVPPQLFSHNDQQVYWQTSRPDSIAKVGWAGRIADVMKAINGNARISMSISLAGTNVFQVGEEVFPYQVGSGGSIGLDAFKNAGTDTKVNARYQAHLHLLNEGTGNLFEAEYAKIVQRAIDNDVLLKSALASAPVMNTVFPANNRLADQLEMIARLISIRDVLGVKRQVFFCSLGGWDTHDDQLDDQANLLAQVSQAVKAFHDATLELGVGQEVTLFSASDFGRSYGINRDGTDHGWGNHHFVCGGAVRGGDIYGRMPVLSIEGPDDTSKGRWIPTTSVDEYSATLAKWFGVADDDIGYVLPNLGRFATRDVGFMG